MVLKMERMGGDRYENGRSGKRHRYEKWEDWEETQI